MIPKRAGGFEQEALDRMAETALPAGSDGVLNLADKREPHRHTGSLEVLDLGGRPVGGGGAEVLLAATTVLTGLDRSRTNTDGYVYFTLPADAGYVVVVRYGDQEEILYLA